MVSPRRSTRSTRNTVAKADIEEKNTEKDTKVTSDDKKFEEAITGFFYRPHRITVFIVVLSYLFYAALYDPNTETIRNIQQGLIAAASVFIVYGMMYLPDGPFIRPHPVFWKFMLCIAVVYEVILVFLLFQNKNDSRKWLSFVDSSLGRPLPERSYAEDCSLTWDVLKDQMDIFVIAHAFGWFAKALILRDYWFCWILSVMFEVMEYSLQHQLPNFAECWWDHWVLDVLLCNWIGLYLGMKTCEYFEMRHYSWRGIHEIKDVKGKVQRTMQQFTPHSWTSFHWGATKSFKNFMAVILLLTFFLQCELNAFYLKYLLWIPSAHILNTLRLGLYSTVGSAGVRECYQYLTDKNCKRIGAYAWTTCACILTELLVCYKYSFGEFTKPAPLPVVVFWIVFVSGIFIYALYQFVYLPWRSKHKKE